MLLIDNGLVMVDRFHGSAKREYAKDLVAYTLLLHSIAYHFPRRRYLNTPRM